MFSGIRIQGSEYSNSLIPTYESSKSDSKFNSKNTVNVVKSTSSLCNRANVDAQFFSNHFVALRTKSELQAFKQPKVCFAEIPVSSFHSYMQIRCNARGTWPDCISFRGNLIERTQTIKIMWGSRHVRVCRSMRPRAFMLGAMGTLLKPHRRSSRNNEKPIRVLTALQEDERMPRNRP